jgi:hypothetical protein
VEAADLSEQHVSAREIERGGGWRAKSVYGAAELVPGPLGLRSMAPSGARAGWTRPGWRFLPTRMAGLVVEDQQWMLVPITALIARPSTRATSSSVPPTCRIGSGGIRVPVHRAAETLRGPRWSPQWNQALVARRNLVREKRAWALSRDGPACH